MARIRRRRDRHLKGDGEGRQGWPAVAHQDAMNDGMCACTDSHETQAWQWPTQSTHTRRYESKQSRPCYHAQIHAHKGAHLLDLVVADGGHPGDGGRQRRGQVLPAVPTRLQRAKQQGKGQEGCDQATTRLSDGRSAIQSRLHHSSSWGWVGLVWSTFCADSASVAEPSPWRERCSPRFKFHSLRHCRRSSGHQRG